MHRQTCFQTLSSVYTIQIATSPSEIGDTLVLMTDLPLTVCHHFVSRKNSA